MTDVAALAADAVRCRLLGVSPETPPPSEPGASFVTLERRGRLRGCIGSLQANRPLYADVQRNAIRAMEDPRMAPVTAEDWPELDVKVSVLTAPAPLAVTSLDELLAVLRPGVDGLVLTDGRRRSTFLPAVWEKLRDPREFVSALLVKGGWAANGWPADLRVARYTSSEVSNHSPRTPL